ncbi:MAG: hypothetical protein QM489_07460 [Candidatus Izemoplasma sp.]
MKRNTIILLNIIIVITSYYLAMSFSDLGSINLLNLSKISSIFNEFPFGIFDDENTLIEIPIFFGIIYIISQIISLKGDTFSKEKIFFGKYLVHLNMIYSIVVISAVYFPTFLGIIIMIITIVLGIYWIIKNYNKPYITDVYEGKLILLSKPYVLFIVTYLIYVLTFFSLGFGSGPQ